MFIYSSRCCLSSSRKSLSLLFLGNNYGQKRLLSTVIPPSSSSSSYVDLDFDSKKGIGYLTMKNGPVNSLSLEMNKAIVSAIQQTESKSDIQSLIIQSSLATVFSAGIDLTELYQPNLIRLEQYWKSFQQLYITLYGSRLACIAAIEGHAIAGGCMITLCCDYRIMTATPAVNELNKFHPTIGLNETKLGIVAPQWLGQQMIDTIGYRNGEKSLQLGILYTPEDALNINLIDSVVTRDTVRSYAQEMAVQFTKIPNEARYYSKLISRRNRIDTMIASRQDDLNTFISTIINPNTQATLSTYLDKIGKRHNKQS